MMTKNEILKKADELNLTAAQGKPLPDGMTLPEQLCFLALRYLYLEYRQKVINVEQAKVEKVKIINAFVENMYNYALYKHQQKVHTVYAKRFKNIKNNGCDVCNELYKTLCGLGLDEDEISEIKE